MSYQILYRSMFVKLNDNKFIPLIETGSNNCYDIMWNGRERRERSWHQLRIQGRHNDFAFTREEIMQEVERWIDDEKEQHANKPKPEYYHDTTPFTEKDIESHFGYFAGMAIEGRNTGDTTAQQVRNFFLKGFEQAVDMAEETPTINLTWNTRNGEKTEYHHHNATTEKDITDKWNELTAEGREVWIGYYCADYLYEQHRRRAVKKAPKEHTTGYVVQFGGLYVNKMTSRRLFYGRYLDNAKVYTTRAAAQKVADRIRTNYDSITDNPVIVEVHKDDTNQWHAAA